MVELREQRKGGLIICEQVRKHHEGSSYLVWCTCISSPLHVITKQNRVTRHIPPTSLRVSTSFEKEYIGDELCPDIINRGSAGRRKNGETIGRRCYITVALMRERPYNVEAGISVMPVLCREHRSRQRESLKCSGVGAGKGIEHLHYSSSSGHCATV